jgi:hypothetical protein
VRTIFSEQLKDPIDNMVIGSSTAITSLNGANNAVTVFSQGQPIASWDGTTAGGRLASNGIYYIKVDNTDRTGVTTSATQQVTVSRALYQVTILVYNETGEVVKHLYAVTDDPGPQGATGVQLSTKVIAPTNGNSSSGVPSQLYIILNNGTTVIWDGRGDNGNLVNNGQYLIEVDTVDGKGGSSVVTQQVSVLSGNRGNVGNIQAEPNVLTRATGYTTTIVDSSGLGLTLTEHLYTMAGELIPQKSSTGIQGSGQVSLDLSGLASGLYIAVVDGAGANGGVVDHQILKIAVFH